MLLPGHHQLLRRRSSTDAPSTPVVADIVDRRLIYDSAIVDRGDVCIGDIICRSIVVKISIPPIPTFVSIAIISKTVVYTTVVTNRRTPITFIEFVISAAISPIPWRPIKSDLWGSHPRAGHPEIILIVVVPLPVTRGPNISVARDPRLTIDRQRRRWKSNTNPNADLSVAQRWRRGDAHAKGHQNGEGRGRKLAHDNSLRLFSCRSLNPLWAMRANEGDSLLAAA